MKKQLPGFLTGVVVSALVFTAAPAIAAQIQTITATLNLVNIEVNGQKVAVSGEDYTLENGKQTAGSIVYNETTYVPIRKFGEIMGAEIGYDGTTGSVTVNGEVKGTTGPTKPTDTTASTDYSDWSKEDEAAYQEFKGMWDVDGLKLTCNNSNTKLLQYFNGQTEEVMLKFVLRLDREIYLISGSKSMPFSNVTYYSGDGTILWQDPCFSGKIQYMGTESYIAWTFNYSGVIEKLSN